MKNQRDPVWTVINFLGIATVVMHARMKGEKWAYEFIQDAAVNNQMRTERYPRLIESHAKKHFEALTESLGELVLEMQTISQAGKLQGL
jgi:hypothetical protein